MNPPIMLAVIVGVGLLILAVMLLARRPDEGWVKFTKDAVQHDSDEPVAEPVDVSIDEILAEAPSGSGYLEPDELLQRASELTKFAAVPRNRAH